MHVAYGKYNFFTEKYIFYKKGVRVERMMLASGRG
jgi:hypothetical protein